MRKSSNYQQLSAYTAYDLYFLLSEKYNIKFPSQNNNMKPNQLNFLTEKIIEQCRTQFINILPSTVSADDPQSKPIDPAHDKEIIKQLIRLLSITIQLTMQNFVLTSDPHIKSNSYKIIVDLKNLLSRDFSEFQSTVTHRGKGHLPQYQVDCYDFLKRQVSLKIQPQVSLYQDPLLYYNSSKVVQEQLLCTHSKQVTRNEKIQLIKKHIPFFDPLYIPLIAERLQSKAKFSQFQDRAILILLKTHGKKKLQDVKSIYFPKRPESQVNNRIKNLYAKEYDNNVKQWRNNQIQPLNQQQRKVLVHAYKRYGPRWPVIAKYYCLRSGDFLQADFYGSPKLLKKRQKQKIVGNNRSIKQDIQQAVVHNAQVIDDPQIHQQLQKAALEEYQQVAKYKIINHVTYLCEEI